MLSATREYDADSCAPQPVLAFSSPSARLRPGDSLALTIQSETGATCGYSVVDKSVDLVPNDNKVSAPKLVSGALSALSVPFSSTHPLLLKP